MKMEVYADVSQTEKPKWKRFRSEKDFEKYRETHDTYSIAYAWQKNGKLVAANFTFTSESGDWAHYIFHRFREDGTLAKVETDLRTFYGHISIVRNFYFDKRGKLLRKTTKYYDMKTNKPVEPSDNFIDEKVWIYKTTRKLPFTKLIR